MNKLSIYHWSDLPRLLGVVLLYALSVKFALAYLTASGNISIVWIPSGIGLAVILIGGRKYWPAILLGALSAYVVWVGRAWQPSVFIAISNVLEPLLCYWLLTRLRIRNTSFDPAFTRTQDYLWLAATAMLAALLAALIGVMTLWLTGIISTAMVPTALLYWWMGNTLGIFIVTPLVLIWRTMPSLWLSRQRVVETITFFGLTFLFGQVIFLGWFNEYFGTFARAYWIFLFITWGSLRFGRHGSFLVIGMVVLQALLGAAQGVGYFGGYGTHSLVALWLYAMSLLGVGITLTLVMHERRQANIKIQRLSRFYAALSHCNQAIVRCTSLEDLFAQICHDAVIFGGMKMAWIGMVDNTTQRVKPVARYGDDNGYLNDIQISVDAASPLGQGPTGISIRENRPFWCQDFINDPHTSAWHERGAIAGWAASASLPLQRNGVVVGTFTLYSTEINAFDEDVRNLLIEMAMDINFGLDCFDREARRKLAEAKLRLAQAELVESHDRYEDLYEFAPVGYFSISKQGLITEVNWKVTSMFGLKRDQINQHSVDEFVVGEEKKHWQEQFLSMQDLEEREELNFDMKFTHNNGSVFIANLNCLRMEDMDEQPILRVAIIDVTQLKQAETALQTRELHLRTIINIEPECIKIVDALGRLKEMNPAGLKMIEADTQEQVLGKRLLDLIAPEYQAAFTELHKRVLAGESGQLEFESIGLKGGRRWLETHAVPMHENSQIVLLGVTRDITYRKFAENNLRIAAIAFESQEGMMVTDANKIILRVNKAFTRISGYSAEEAIGQTPRLVSSGHHHSDFYDSMWESIAKNGGWEGEVWNRRKNGEVYPQHLTITAVKGAGDIVTNYVATFTDVTLRNAAEAKINHLAFYDVLTRLPNRRLLIDRLNHALSSGARLGWGGALLFLDLDHFKTLNDTLGHDVGDLLLQQVAERLTDCMREGDTVARLGGDEFVVMLENLSKQPIEAAAQAETIANKILATLYQPFELSTNTYQITASIGVVLFSDNEHSQEVLLKHADIAMYQAKKAGRNTLCFFDPDMQEAINTRAALEIDLRKALDSQQFQLYYQIQVNRLGQPLGAEALIRWLHPERGLVHPFRFIALVEETGLILPVGQWVMETSCAQLRAWQQDPMTRDLTLSVNVSAKQFYQSNFVAQVQDAVQRYGINPMQLKLELTESILLERIEDTIATMHKLRAIGVNFALDDFGTGYSSLQYLKLLPLYQLKIDQSFVRDIAIDSSDQAIVRTVIAMAQTLNLDVIAEGVENEVQRELLVSCGCNTFQGNLFGKPVPIKEFMAALKTNRLK